MNYCQLCFQQAPTKYVEIHQNVGLLVVRFHRSLKGNFCRDCIGSAFWTYSGITLLLGWWGVISFIVTPFILVNNIVQYLSGLTIGRPNSKTVNRPEATRGQSPVASDPTLPRDSYRLSSSEASDFFSDYPSTVEEAESWTRDSQQSRRSRI